MSSRRWSVSTALVPMIVGFVTPMALEAQQVAYAATAVSALDSVTQAAVARELVRARTRGLPVQPLMAKVREGQIKRAAPERIRIAVAALSVRLDSARSALGPTSTAAELVAGADAIAAGVDQESLRTVRTASGARDLAAPLGALAQLVASGVEARRATRMIVELLKKDAGPRELLAFGMAVETDVGAGVPAEESAVFRLRAIETQGVGSERVTVAGAPDIPLGQTTTGRPSGGTKRKP
ncbi:MAG: hypothetical protein DMD35_05630 [Gemmatimonadetes bacterium]|nr:MAG: hypothetical protein DMD35_05630 [Gemmatimonadota bacterium]